MIITCEPGVSDATVDTILRMVARYEGVEPRTYHYEGESERITEIHFIGETQKVPEQPFRELPGILRVVRVSSRYRRIGRHSGAEDDLAFDYNGVRFAPDTLNVFAGLCAVDTPEHVELIMKALKENGVHTTRMGAYKPRTSPYSFQGHGKDCLPWVFELAGKYDIRVISMEVTSPRHIEEIESALEATGNPTGVMLQIGTRNAQNFELLKAVGQQERFPVLFKRGYGITLEESLNAVEYVASNGNANIVFCLRGVKTHLGDPHRNLVDFIHIPVVRRQTRLSVCIDPSHSVGRMDYAPDGIPDGLHAVAQGLISGASNILVDFHPKPAVALCDGPQALLPEQLPAFLEFVHAVRDTYGSLVEIASGLQSS